MGFDKIINAEKKSELLFNNFTSWSYSRSFFGGFKYPATVALRSEISVARRAGRVAPAAKRGRPGKAGV